MKKTLRAGSVIDIDGTHYILEEGPWRFEHDKKAKTGFGVYVPLRIDNEQWHQRCGLDALDFFGYKYTIIEAVYEPPPLPDLSFTSKKKKEESK